MGHQTLAQMLTACRDNLHDNITSNLASDESPDGSLDGTNKRFKVKHRNLLGVEVRIDGVLQTVTTHYTVDAVRGIITFASAPAVEKIIKITYYWQHYTDTEFYQFIHKSGEDLGFYGTGATEVLQATALLAALDGKLYPALKQYVGYHFYMACATDYAPLFPASGGGQSFTLNAPASEYRKLAEMSKKRGDELVVSAYTDFGRRAMPKSQRFSMRGAGRYQPRR